MAHSQWPLPGKSQSREAHLHSQALPHPRQPPTAVTRHAKGRKRPVCHVGLWAGIAAILNSSQAVICPCLVTSLPRPISCYSLMIFSKWVGMSEQGRSSVLNPELRKGGRLSAAFIHASRRARTLLTGREPAVDAGPLGQCHS